MEGSPAPQKKKKRGRPKGWKASQKNTEQSLYKCQDCKHEFMSKLQLLDVVCVKCRSLNVESVKA